MRVAWIPLFVACVCVPSAAQTSEDDWQRHPDGTLSVRLEGAPLAETLLRVAGFGGLEVVFDAQALADRRVSARFERKTPEQVWRLLITSQNLRDRLADGVHCVEVPDTEPGLPQPPDEQPVDPSPPEPVPVDPVPVDPGPEEPAGPLEGSLTSEVPFEGAPAPEQAVVLSVDVGVTALYRFDVDGPMGRMRLEDQAGHSLAETEDASLRRPLRPGLYRLWVEGPGGGALRCTLTLERAMRPPGSDRGRPAGLRLGAEATGALPSTGSFWLRVQLPEEGLYILETAGSDFDTVLSLETLSGGRVAADDDGGPGGTSTIAAWLPADDYLLHLEGFGGARGTFRVVARAVTLDPLRASATQGLRLDANGRAWRVLELPRAGAWALSVVGSDEPVRMQVLSTDAAARVRARGADLLACGLPAERLLVAFEADEGPQELSVRVEEVEPLQTLRVGEEVSLPEGWPRWIELDLDRDGLVRLGGAPRGTGGAPLLTALFDADFGPVLAWEAHRAPREVLLSEGRYWLRAQSAGGPVRVQRVELPAIVPNLSLSVPPRPHGPSWVRLRPQRAGLYLVQARDARGRPVPVELASEPTALNAGPEGSWVGFFPAQTCFARPRAANDGPVTWRLEPYDAPPLALGSPASSPDGDRAWFTFEAERAGVYRVETEGGTSATTALRGVEGVFLGAARRSTLERPLAAGTAWVSVSGGGAPARVTVQARPTPTLALGRPVQGWIAPGTTAWFHLELPRAATVAVDAGGSAGSAPLAVWAPGRSALAQGTNRLELELPAGDYYISLEDAGGRYRIGAAVIDLPDLPGRTIDLRHVRPGQRYTYTLTPGDGPSWVLDYEVTAVEGHLVRYVSRAWVEGRRPDDVPEVALLWSPEAPPGALQAPVEGFEVSGRAFEARPVRAPDEDGVLWLSYLGGRPTFPGVLRAETEFGRLELVAIEDAPR